MSEAADTIPPEFSRLTDLREIGDRPVELAATPDECARLAARFDLVAIHSLTATVTLERDGPAVRAKGRLNASIIQSCAVSGDDLPVTIADELNLRFIPAAGTHRPDEEVELSAEECDEIEFSGTQFDLGEAVAQSMVLAIDLFATGPNAEKARKSAGLLNEASGGAFAALAALKKTD